MAAGNPPTYLQSSWDKQMDSDSTLQSAEKEGSSSLEVRRLGFWPEGVRFNLETFREKQGVDICGEVVVHIQAITQTEP